MSKYFKHFKMILKHKWFVFKACCRAGIIWRGIMHDMSKFSPIEFFESGRYFTGKSSPIDVAKKTQGVSYAWQHHKGRNPHHWEYWVDNLSDGGVGRAMPYKYALEMICDYIGAGQAYEGSDWSFDRPYDYWAEERAFRAKIHPSTLEFIDSIFWTIKEEQNYNALSKSYTKSVYKYAMEGLA